MTNEEIVNLSLIDVRDKLAAGELSAEAVMAANIAQAERFADFNLFLTFLPEAAMEEARAADKALAEGRLLGPLHGVPFHVKDNIDYAGVRTSAGSKVLEDRKPALDEIGRAHV